ncbi:MAG: roadblock/LC7 domain-containing protein [Methanomicrobia archaeon]|nr:roadblock/LC7 domain-containing protein [Methanomicrobia archaeon]
MRKELLDKVLSELKNVVSIEASAIVTRSGLLISADIPQQINAETFAAMSATILGASETATREMEKGTPKRVVVTTEKEIIITMGAGEKALLVCITSEPNLGLLFIELEKAAAKVKKIL